MVIIFHYNVARILVDPHDNRLILFNTIDGVGVGTIGVQLFFIISAAGLAISFARKNATLDTAVLKEYAKKRFVKIFPRVLDLLSTRRSLQLISAVEDCKVHQFRSGSLFGHFLGLTNRSLWLAIPTSFWSESGFWAY
ncbi:MAG: hypothetical protein LBP35_04900 [Candidatus Ancillula trichonymphae]|nr:hypothetical protein [Candidatus Ancillula trichonymphae]